MYCGNCGTELADNFRFCQKCGNPIAPQRATPSEPDRVNISASETQVDAAAQEDTYPDDLISTDTASQDISAVVDTHFGEQPSLSDLDEIEAENVGYTTPHDAAVDHQEIDAARPATIEQKPRRRYVLACGLMAALLCVVCAASSAGAYYWFGLNRGDEAAKMVPAGSTAFASFSPNLLQLAQAADIGNLSDGAGGLAVLAGLPGVLEFLDILGDSNVDLDIDIDPVRDLLPWIGPEISLAVLPNDDTFSGDYLGPPLVVMIQTRNDAASDRFLANIRSQLEDKGIVFSSSEHRDQQIFEVIEPANLSLAQTTVGGMVVLATSASALEQVIDLSYGSSLDTLYSQVDFTEIRNELPANRLGYIFIEGDALIQSLNMDEDSAEKYGLHALDKAGVAASLTGSGIRFDYVFKFIDEDLTRAQKKLLRSTVSGLDMSQAAPAETLTIISGSDPELIWNGLLASDFERAVDRLRRESGIDLTRDLIGEFEGEFALITTRQLDGLWDRYSLVVDLLLLTEYEDRSAIERALEIVFHSASETRGLRVGEDKVAGIPIQTLETDRYFVLGYGFDGDRLVLGTSLDVIEAAVEAETDPLADQRSFRTAARTFPRDMIAYAYVDVQRGLDVVDRGKEVYDQGSLYRVIEPYLGPIQSVSMAIEPLDDSGFVRGVTLLATN